MANIAHPDAEQTRVLLRGLARTAVFVAGFALLVLVAGQLG